jgi:hypothetical protein
MLMQPNINAGLLNRSVVLANYGLVRVIKLMVIALSLRDQYLLAVGVKTLRLKKLPNFFPTSLLNLYQPLDIFSALVGGQESFYLKN